MKDNYLKLFKEYKKTIFSHPFHSLLFVTGIIVSSFTQMLSFGTLYPIVMYVINKEAKDNRIINIFKDILSFIYLEANLLNFLIVFILLSAISTAFYILIQVQQGFFIRNIEINLRSELLGKVVRSNWSKLINLDHGRYLNCVTREVERNRDLVKYMFMITASIIQVAVYMSYALFLTPTLVLISMAILIVNFLMFFPILKLYFKFSEMWTEFLGKVNNIVIQMERGLKFIKANSKEEHILSTILPMVRNIARIHFKGHLLGVLQSRLAELMSFFVFAIILYISTEILKFEVAILVLILALFYKIIPEVKSVIDFAHNATSLLPSSLEVNFFFNSYFVEEDTTEKVSLSEIQSIQLNEVSFKYEEKIVLNGLSQEFKKGEFWAITGASGVGKTTLLDLVSGILKPSSGSLSFNSIDYDKLNLIQVHSRVGYMTQETFVVEGSILENLTWGTGEINQERLQAAIRIAQLHFWDSNENSENGKIIQGGLNLSGGQKQRIAIARTLVNDYDFILFDEPTASLDSETEANFIKELMELKGRVGILMVTHRQECLKIMDSILNFDEDGKIKIINKKNE